ncbi:MAG: hypothetical protein ABL986_00140 [Vicinamibacterales bacterium]
MTNVSKTVKKTRLRRWLRDIAIKALQDEGWTVGRVPGGSSSVRRITKNKESKTVSIRTSQDAWIAFPRNQEDTDWVTLSEVDEVVAASLDPDDHAFATVFRLDGDDVRRRFDRAYKARIDAGYSIPVGRGVWVSLFREESTDPVTHVGAGIARGRRPLVRVPLEIDTAGLQPEVELEPYVASGDGRDNTPPSTRTPSAADNEGITIPEAKRRLALHLGVDPSSIKITVEA